MRRSTLIFALALWGCADGAQPTQSSPAAASNSGPAVVAPPAASSSSDVKPVDCATLADHWRAVWTTEARSGLERRARKAADYVAHDWNRLCNKLIPARSVLEDLRKLRTFSAIAQEPQTGGENRRLLLATMQGLALRSQIAYGTAASGTEECEDAFVDAAFCGDVADTIDRVTKVRAFADTNDAVGCRTYMTTLSSRCPGQ